MMLTAFRSLIGCFSEVSGDRLRSRLRGPLTLYLLIIDYFPQIRGIFVSFKFKGEVS
jgi:hypothetical protein